MTDTTLPSTSAGLVAVTSDERRSLVVDMALDLERARRFVLRGFFGGLGVVVAGVIVVSSVHVFGVGAFLCLVFVLAATLGVSLTLATAALTGTAIDALTGLHWRRIAARYGLDPRAAEQVLDDARRRLLDAERDKVALARAREGHLLAAPPRVP